MRLLYSYAGPRDAAFERRIERLVAQQFCPCRQTGSDSGKEGLTLVALEVERDDCGLPAVARLRDEERIVDAARESFGEGV